MIDIRKFPPYFVSDSMGRGVFKPESDDFASEEQVRILLSDAEFYADKYGPDECPPGLKPSAKATIRHCKKALGL